ncbi:MAG: hypothetical protein HPAVJP_3100 [Candidatus Hepatoplasma vulgare]|nr:MAG: hypothetical protein HPAVJP_3100 [Candidatus Hepatoplasma sp.]
MENENKINESEILSKENEIELEKIVNTIKELENKNLELLADIDNLRKKHQKEIIETEKYALIKFLRDFLSSFDMFDSVLNNKNVSEEVKNWLKGFEMIHQNIKNLLDQYKIKKVNAKLGENFNSNYHFAISEDFSSEIENGRILKILQNGYLLNDRLIKPSIVVISKGLKEEENENKEQK